MKVPEIFLPEKKLDNKVEELMKEKPLQKSQSNKDEIPRYAVQENGDYLVMRGGIITYMPDHKKITSANFNFTINGKEHDLFVNGKEHDLLIGREIAKLDGKFVKIEENLISNLFELGLTVSYKPDINRNSWELDMIYITKEAYKELVKLVNNA